MQAIDLKEYNGGGHSLEEPLSMDFLCLTGNEQGIFANLVANSQFRRLFPHVFNELHAITLKPRTGK